MKADGLNHARFMVIPMLTLYPWTGLIVSMLLFAVVAQKPISQGHDSRGGERMKT